MFGYESFWSGIALVIGHIKFTEEMMRLLEFEDVEHYVESRAYWLAVLDYRLGFTDEYPLPE